MIIEKQRALSDFTSVLSPRQVVSPCRVKRQMEIVRFPRSVTRFARRIPSTLMLVMAGCVASDDAPEIAVRQVRHWSMPPAGKIIPAPRSICVGLQNEAYVLDNAGRVLVFSSAGKLVRQWKMPDYEVGKPEGICLLEDGRIAVADTHYHRVVFFDRDGAIQGMHGQYGEGSGEFIYPVAITQDDQQNYYVCEYGGNDRVQKFSADGNFLLTFGSFGTSAGQFQRPSGIVWNEGQVFVADAINNRVQVFSDAGAFQHMLQSEGRSAPLHHPYDMVKGNGSLYVVEYGAGRLTCLDTRGRLLGRWGQTGSSKGELATPWGLAIGESRLLIADTGNRRIVELEL